MVPEDTECGKQNKITARQTVLDGCPVLPKLQCHEIQMGQDARLLWNMKDTSGSVVDLSTCASECSVSSEAQEFDSVGPVNCGIELRLRELSGFDPNDSIYSVSTTILDASTGYVRSASLPEELVRNPGVYLEEWALTTPDGRMLFSNQCISFVRRGLFGISADPNLRNLGPPTIEEIRLAMRDNSPADNLLLDDIEFDSAEIAQAVLRPIQFWNEIPPPVRPALTTKTFPFREMWMLGIQSYLLEIAAHHYRRNQLAYNAGGIAIDDKNKEQYYSAAARQLTVRFQEMARAKKIEINISLFSGSVGSPYSGLFY